jgi:hypothetical protein
MAEQDYYQKYIGEIVGGMMPNINVQKKGMYDFMQAQSLRTGQPTSGIAEAMRPFADAAGEGAARAGVQATQMAQKQEQFDTQQANWQKSFDQGQKNWEESMAFQKEQQSMANMVKMFEHTGWTEELMNAMGYDKDSGGGVQFQRMLDDLGFKNPEGTGEDASNDYGYWDRGSNLNAANNWGGKTGLLYG